MMTEADKKYRNLNNRIGAALLIFLAFFTGGQIIQSEFDLLIEYFASGKVSYIASSLLWDVIYLCSFMLPVLFFYKISKNHHTEKMIIGNRVSPLLPLIVLSALALNLVASVINAWLVSPFDLSSLYENVTYPDGYHLYDFILEVIGTAIVPAFCEEFLFRGLILACLLPYGKKTAVIGSAVLFGLMHQNPAQLFYTIVLGMVLALIVIESESIWGAVILHFVNNLFSVIMNACYYVMPADQADFITNLAVLAVLAVGFVCGAVLIVLRLKKNRKTKLTEDMMSRRNINDGVFGYYEIAEAETGNDFGVSKKYYVKGFFAPCIVVFTVLSVLSMVLLIILAALNGIVM